MTDTVSAAPRNEVEFDHHGPEFRDHRQEVIERLHGTGCPLGHSSAHGGFWALYGYDAIYDAVQDAELFSSARSAETPKMVPPSSLSEPLIPIDVDGPEVKEYRRVALSRMSPAGAKALEPRVREIATELIDAFIERGEADLSQELFTPLPARMILEILGWEAHRWGEWQSWVHTALHDGTLHPEAAAEAITTILTSIDNELAKRRNVLSDDLFSDILRARFDGEPFTDSQVIGYGFLLLLGGMDTTAGLSGNTIIELDRRPDLRRQLIEDRSLLPAATEEFLRHNSPAFGLYRTVTRDVVFHGQQLQKGDRVILMFPAAGVDPNQFERPNEIDFARSDTRHMAFGLGSHRCLGSHLARVMYQVMMDEVLTRLPDFEISGEVIRFEDSGDNHAVRYLPVRFTPGRAPGANVGR